MSDVRVRPLALSIKKWGKVRGITDSKHQMMNAYTLVLMTINSLQLCEPPIVPALTVRRTSPHSFAVTPDPHQWQSKNSSSLATLFAHFFTCFATFEHEVSVISVRRGCLLQKKGKKGGVGTDEYSPCPASEWCVEDPIS